MMSAENSEGYILASSATKEDGPFTCPICGGPVLVKKGRITIHHFAHIPPTNCAYGAGESEKHRQVKRDIYAALSTHPDVSKLQLERPLGDVRPDISFYLGNIPIAIEVQVSTLSLDTIDTRTRAYKRKGISLLWISPYDIAIQHGEQYSPRLWEKYIHTLYFGKVYYWISGEMVRPVHFDEYLIHVEATEWYEDGYMRYEGGYDRYSKRYRTPRFQKDVLITSLSRVPRDAWEGPTMIVPEANLWCEPHK